MNLTKLLSRLQSIRRLILGWLARLAQPLNGHHYPSMHDNDACMYNWSEPLAAN